MVIKAEGVDDFWEALTKSPAERESTAIWTRIRTWLFTLLAIGKGLKKVQHQKHQPWRNGASQENQINAEKMASLGDGAVKRRKERRGKSRSLMKYKRNKTHNSYPSSVQQQKSSLNQPTPKKTKLTGRIVLKVGTLSVRWKWLAKKHTMSTQSYCKKSNDVNKALLLMKILPLDKSWSWRKL